MLLFSGNANIPLARNIAIALNATLDLTLSQYSDGESKITVHQEIQNQDVFIIQPTSFPANHNIIELCLLANTLRAKQARSITAVVPYFGYGRHDGDLNNGPSNAKLIMDLLIASGINRLITLDVHSKRLQKFLGLDLINISAMPLFANIPQIRQLQEPVIVSPDTGGIKRSQEFAKLLGNASTAILSKQRCSGNKTSTASIIGNVVNRNCIIVDDIIDTGNTIYTAAAALKDQGAQQIYVCCTHAVLSENALMCLQQSACDKIFATDSIRPKHDLTSAPKLSFVSIADLLAEVIHNR